MSSYDELMSVASSLSDSAASGGLDTGYEITEVAMALPDDVCGVAGGDGSTCYDACGVANGDNSTCADVCGKVNGDDYRITPPTVLLKPAEREERPAPPWGLITAARSARILQSEAAEEPDPKCSISRKKAIESAIRGSIKKT